MIQSLWKIWWKTRVVHAGEIEILLKAWVVNALFKPVTPVLYYYYFFLRFLMLQAAHHTRASQYPDFKEIQEREGHRKLCENRQASPLRKVPLYISVVDMLANAWHLKWQSSNKVHKTTASPRENPSRIFIFSFSHSHAHRESIWNALPRIWWPALYGVGIYWIVKNKNLKWTPKPLYHHQIKFIFHCTCWSRKIYID